MVAVFSALIFTLRAQVPTPHIGYVYPAGGCIGNSFRVTVGGQFLDGPTNALIRGEGVRATVIDYLKPLTQGQFNNLREKLQELQKQKKDAATLAQIAEIRKKMATFNRNANPAIADKVTLQVTIATNAEPGQRELRLKGGNGLSNPLVFCVGTLPEFTKKALAPGDGAALFGRRRYDQQRAVEASEMSVTLPATVNGQILPGGVDRYKFAARKGQELVIAVSARQLIPYLPDAVPGWFQATVALFDSRGHELAYDDDFRFNPDPVLHYQIPADGQYSIEVKDAIYRGREDFVYRIAIGELPFITALFPLGGRAGEATTVELRGWNLPRTNLVYTPNSATGFESIRVRRAAFVSNPMPFATSSLREIMEREPNDVGDDSRSPVDLGSVINGSIDRPGDVDVFVLSGRAGQQIVAEVYARRLNSPVDSILKLTDAAGKILAENDDHDDKGSGLNTHHADSLLQVRLPADGRYYLHLADRQRKGGAEFAYRLRLSEPMPDFGLRIAPSSLTVRGGATVPVTVYALRRDGFSGEIALSLTDDRSGFSLRGGRVPAGQDKVTVTLTAPSTGAAQVHTPRLQGRAKIGDRDAVREAVPADDLMQAFAYRHLVPSAEWCVAVSGRANARLVARPMAGETLRIPSGGAAALHIDVPRFGVAEGLRFELNDPPAGLSINTSASATSTGRIELLADASKLAPGARGNVIVTAYADRGRSGSKSNTNRRRVPLGTLPAIPFEIVEK